MTDRFNADLLDFLTTAPTAYHAAARLAAMFQAAGFQRLDEADAWVLKAGHGYCVTRSDAALVAFVAGRAADPADGIRMVGAHTDSPALKLKPRPERLLRGYLTLGVEVYGSPTLESWLDRDLSVAGRVTYLDDRQALHTTLLDLARPVALIPRLARHFQPPGATPEPPNPQEHLAPLVSQSAPGAAADLRGLLARELAASHPDVERVLDADLFLYDLQPPVLAGWNREFISGGRLDNLLSCFVGARALVEAAPAITAAGSTALLVCNHHEEVGSLSTAGAQGSFLQTVLARLCPDAERRHRMLARSVLVSTDNAHGVHPHYAAKFDPTHAPLLNHGPVIKFNAAQRYASDSRTAALFRRLAELERIPVQEFVMRADLPCGTTIGPLTAARTGVSTVDVGLPTFAMHSIREVAGARDVYMLYRVLRRFFHEE